MSVQAQDDFRHSPLKGLTWKTTEVGLRILEKLKKKKLDINNEEDSDTVTHCYSDRHNSDCV